MISFHSTANAATCGKIRRSGNTSKLHSIARNDNNVVFIQNYIVDDDFVVMVNSTEQRKLQKANSFVEMSEEEKALHAKAIAAGITTGAVGLVLGGPVAAAIIGFGTAFVAKNDKNTPVGEAARTFGEMAIHATDKVKEVDAIHQLTSQTARKVEEINAKYQISEKGTELFHKSKVVDTVNGLAAGVNHLANTTQNRVRHYNEKHGWTDRINAAWKDFERTILLTDDDVEFHRQIQYLLMERELEKEEEQLEYEADEAQIPFVIVNNDNINHQPFTLVN